MNFRETNCDETCYYDHDTHRPLRRCALAQYQDATEETNDRNDC